MAGNLSVPRHGMRWIDCLVNSPDPRLADLAMDAGGRPKASRGGPARTEPPNPGWAPGSQDPFRWAASRLTRRAAPG
jgi:hypothetical protein